eukprot:TRINITY_DN13910_c0_g1_i1.p1 TRINITY_DN13910_c0_g1~~TRINITY_DN13910_c0_g1_i1.p1  ORF type:complete len:485 (+),score=105.21 TRINITY_DN13910_c0_g1_i1:159-1613(+)
MAGGMHAGKQSSAACDAGSVDGSSESAKGSKESAAAGTDCKDAVTDGGSINVFAEVLKMAGIASGRAAASEAIGRLTNKELDEIKRMLSPPMVVRRALEVTWVLLHVGRMSSPFVPPPWERVQRMLADVGFLGRIQSYDGGALKASPELAMWIGSEYFLALPSIPTGSRWKAARSTLRSSTVFSGTSLRRSITGASAADTPLGSKEHVQVPVKRASTISYKRASTVAVAVEPLTYQRVERASRATAALFHWCTINLKEATAPEPEEEVEDEPPEPPKPETPPPPPKPEMPVEPEPVVATIIVENTVAPVLPPQVPKEVRPAPPLLPPVKTAAPPSPKQIPASAKPDRHFEAFVPFDRGYGNLADESIPALQNVAAVMCMRRKFVLEVVGCPDRIEHAATNVARIRAVGEFFEKEGLECEPATEKTRVAKEGTDPGIICKLLLTNDRELRDFFLMRENGETLQLSSHTKCLVEGLEEDFKTCMAV